MRAAARALRVDESVETSTSRLLYELTRSGARAGILEAEGFTPLEQAIARARVQADLTAERQAGQTPSRETP